MTKPKYNLLQAYVHFDSYDVTGNKVLSSYTLPQTPLTFVPDFTTSDLLSSARSVSNKVIRWDFGDKTYSNQLTAIKNYQWPGQYTVTLTVFDKYGVAYESRYKPTVIIEDFIPTSLEWGPYGKYVYDVPASHLGDPLTLYSYNSWQSYAVLSATGITINLYASGAAGDWMDNEDFNRDKWAHLRLLSKFYEIENYNGTEQYVVVDAVTARTTEIYANINNNSIQICDKTTPGAFLVGTTGYNEVYYTDDRAKNYSSRENPIFLVATFDTAKFKDEFSQRRDLFKYIDYPPYGFQNYKPLFFPAVKTRFNPADHLSITTTGIDGEGALSSTRFNIPSISWQSTEIPFVVKFKDSGDFTTKCYPPLSSSSTGTIDDSLSAYNVRLGIVATDENNNQYQLSDVTFYEDFSPEIPQSIGSFYKGYFKADIPATQCTLTAQCIVVDPLYYPKDTLIGWVSMPQYNYLLRLFKEEIYDSCQGTVNLTLTSRNLYVPIGPHQEILSLCVAPSGAGLGNDYEAWAADVAMDTILKFDSFGNLLSSISLSSTPTLINKTITNVDYRSSVMPGAEDGVARGASPSNIALDGNNDLWVALYDSALIIKIDGKYGYVTAVAQPPSPNQFFLLGTDYNNPVLSGFAGEGLLLPGSVDTDIDNNIWVSYTHPVSNFVVKYDTYGNILNIIPFPAVISPIEICADRNKKVWITTFNHTVSGQTLDERNDYVYRYAYDGTLDAGFPVGGFKMLNNITIDSAQNAWVSHKQATVTKIDQFSLNTTDYLAGMSGNNTTSYICSIVGIAIDGADYLWALNDYDKQLYIIDTRQEPTDYFNYLNSVPLTFPNPLDQYPDTNFDIRQFQAYGDWYGQRWVNKYINPITVTRIVSGSSAPFNIYPLSGQYVINKINEDWNAKEFYKSLRYQETLLDKTEFFDNFLGGIVGGDGQPYELGKTVYEKIANFVENRSDIDTCNIDALVSFCDELSIQFDQYNYPYPPQLRRLVDLLSVKQKRLWGDQNTYNENFDSRGVFVPNVYYGTNLGTEITTVTGTISSGNPLVAYELFSGNYTIVNFSGIPSTTINEVLPLSTFTYDWGWGLVAPRSLSGVEISNYYKFYTLVPTQSASFYNNIIDWFNTNTTLNPYSSSYSAWTDNDGIVQNILSYELTKGLRLFTSGVDITYNN